mgnify:CR=1 FL=1
MHVSADIGCHSFATFAPFSQGNSILGYGMSLASAAAVSGTQTNRPISVMGDGGFWHNGLITGVAGAVFNKDDSRAGRHEQRLFQRHRPAGHPLQQGGAGRPRQGPRHRGSLEEHGRAVDQARAHLWRGGRGQHAARGAAHRPEGPQGHHRRRRMPARAPAAHPAGDRAIRLRPASAWCAPASGSTRRCAPATTPASASRAAPRSPSSPARTRCAPTPSPTSTTTAWAAGCAARSRTRPSSARRSRRSTSSRTRRRWDRLKRRTIGGAHAPARRRPRNVGAPALVPAE